MAASCSTSPRQSPLHVPSSSAAAGGGSPSPGLPASASASSRRRRFVMYNKAPMWNETSQVYQLDFGGRVTQESAKNFQIEFGGKQVRPASQLSTLHCLLLYVLSDEVFNSILQLSISRRPLTSSKQHPTSNDCLTERNLVFLSVFLVLTSEIAVSLSRGVW